MNGENALAAWGTVLHMLNHSLIKLVLFVAAGVVYLGTHSLNLNDIRGWGRNKPVLKVLFFVGAASIAGVPGFSGYVSKTLLHESIVEYIHVLEHAGAAAGWFTTVEWLFLLSGGLTAAYMTKLFVAIFVSSRAVGQRPALKDYMSPGTHAALSVGAALLLVLGLTPGLTMEPLAQWTYESSNYIELMNIASAAPVYESKIEKYTKILSRFYTPIMVVLGLILGIVLPIIDFHTYRSYIHVGAVLLILSGALSSDQSTSLGMLAGFAKAFRNGIIIESSLGLDSINACQTIVMIVLMVLK